MLITLLIESCNLLSWLSLAFVDVTPGSPQLKNLKKVLVTVTDSAANM